MVTCQCSLTQAGMNCECSQLCVQGETSSVSFTVPCVSVMLVVVVVVVVVVVCGGGGRGVKARHLYLSVSSVLGW